MNITRAWEKLENGAEAIYCYLPGGEEMTIYPNAIRDEDITIPVKMLKSNNWWEVTFNKGEKTLWNKAEMIEGHDRFGAVRMFSQPDVSDAVKNLASECKEGGFVHNKIKELFGEELLR